jgi:hypothetical protein
VIEVKEVPNLRVSVSVDAGSNRLSIVGDKSHLRTFSENVRWLAHDGAAGEHLHIDYFPTHLWLAESSAPLVLKLVDA